jgi:hypothetical protein
MRSNHSLQADVPDGPQPELERYSLLAPESLGGSARFLSAFIGVHLRFQIYA